MNYILPEDGGCWFCFTETNENKEFSDTYESYFHKSCCLRASEIGDPDAECMLEELEYEM